MTAFTSHGVGGAVLPMSVHLSRRVSCLAFLGDHSPMSVRQWLDFIRSVVSLLPLPTGMHVGLMRHGHRDEEA
jgi:hypothetical protein